MMSSDDYQVQNIYRYSRKSYKKSRRVGQDNESVNPMQEVEVTEVTPRNEIRNEGCGFDQACSQDPGDLASILHKKCPVISLAQQQLQNLLEGTDRLLCDNTRCCRSFYDFLIICREVILKQHKCKCAVLMFVITAFCLGIIFGAATCGTYLRQFNSPILSCIDSFFIPDTYPTIEQTFRSIV